MSENDGIFFCTMRDLKIGEFKAKLREAPENMAKFYEDHKEFCLRVIIPAAAAVIGIGKAQIRAANRRTVARKQNDDKDMRMYDPSLHCWWSFTRKPTNAEKLIIATRRRSGEKLVTILSDLDLL